MRKVTYSMSMSLDGFIVDPTGGLDWAVPDEDVFQLSLDEIRDVGVHLMGSRLYETMRFWELVDPDTLDDAEREWISLWNPLPKLVFSRTLTAVEGNARLATESIADEIARLRAEGGEGDIAIGGARLAAEVARHGLIDEYVIRIHPVLVGGGIPFFAHDERHVPLELVSSRTVGDGVLYVRYRRRD